MSHETCAFFMTQVNGEKSQLPFFIPVYKPMFVEKLTFTLSITLFFEQCFV